MNTASACLKASAFFFIVAGGIVNLLYESNYAIVLFFAVALGIIAVVKNIDDKNRTAARIGVVLLSIYALSPFFFLGIPGLVAAYRSRNEWMAWGEQA